MTAAKVVAMMAIAKKPVSQANCAALLFHRVPLQEAGMQSCRQAPVGECESYYDVQRKGGLVPCATAGIGPTGRRCVEGDEICPHLSALLGR